MTSQPPFPAQLVGKNPGDGSVAFGPTVLRGSSITVKYVFKLSNHDIECINMNKR